MKKNLTVLAALALSTAALATPAIAQENWINRDCAKYGASEVARTVGTIKPGAVSPYILEKLRQKDAPKIEAARQECEWRKQQQIEAKAAKEEAERQARIEAARQETLRKEAEQEAERQAKIEAARQETLRKEAEQKAVAEKAERDRKDAEARVAMCYGAVPNDKAQELANIAINDVRAKMDLKSAPVDQLVADRLRSLLGQHLTAESDDKRMPGFTRLTVTKQAAAVVVACYDGVQQLMKEQVRAIEEAQRAERAATSIAGSITGNNVERKAPATVGGDFQVDHISGGLKPDYIIATQAFGCAILNEGALSTGGATGRIFDLSNPDQCRSIRVGTPVLSQKHVTNAMCVVPEGASAPCLWVLNDKLKMMSSSTVVEQPKTANDTFAEWVDTLIWYDKSCEPLGPGFKEAAIDALGPIPRETNLAALKRLSEFRASVGAERFCEITKEKIAANHKWLFQVR